MSGKTRHECGRCGHQWLARNDAFYDELVAWIQYVDELEADYRHDIALLRRELAHANDAAERQAHRQAAEEFDAILVEAATRLADEESQF